MKAIQKTLTTLGLTKTEASVYEIGLREGEVDVPTVSRLLNLNRATAYHAVYTLEQKGLLQKRVENGKLILTMMREEALQSFFDFEVQKLKERKEALSELFASLPPKIQKRAIPEIQYFSGIDGIKAAFEIAFRAQRKHWDIIAPRKNFLYEVDESYATYYLAERKRRKITSRSLWERDMRSKPIPAQDLKERQPRYLPVQYANTFSALLILFDTRALFVSTTKEMQAVLINSKDIHSTLQMQFNVLWELGEKPEVVAKK